MVTITKARHVKDKTLTLCFSDGVMADIDFSKWVEAYPFFEPLKDLRYFKNFSLDGWTVVWPNGADIAPETLHEIALMSRRSQAS